MVALLEQNPNAKATINFAPILLEQIADYALRLRAYLDRGTDIGDSLLNYLVGDPTEWTSSETLAVAKRCLHANQKHQINGNPPFAKLTTLFQKILDEPTLLPYLSAHSATDLCVWFHLAWLGETVRQSNSRVASLIAQESNFDESQRRMLLEVIAELLENVTGRYQKLQDKGQIELAMSPYSHAMLPQLIDFESARQAHPNVDLPNAEHYPNGIDRARTQLEKGIQTFEQVFGKRPAGCWPSEGGLSQDTLSLLQEYDFEWTASGENVLRNTIAHSGMSTDKCIHHPYQIDENKVTCFFRDDQLSDHIGFVFSDWGSTDAVSHFLHIVKQIGAACETDKERVISVILDGENAWEHYPSNGFSFLTELYQRLSQDPSIQMTTFSECIAEGMKGEKLSTLVAGSWVYGNFDTWIGSAAKNHAWDLLVRAYDDCIAAPHESGVDDEKLRRQLFVCEGSDWFWWLNDSDPSSAVTEMDSLFRHHLKTLYILAKKKPPSELSRSLAEGSRHAMHSGTMRHSQKEVG